MTLIHHPTLRVNSSVPDDTVEIWIQQGWQIGPHPDSDPDDDRAIPHVLGAPDEEPPSPFPDPMPVMPSAEAAQAAQDARDAQEAAASPQPTTKRKD